MLKVGDFIFAKAGTHHRVNTEDQETIILVYGQRHVELTYVNLAEDPRLGDPAPGPRGRARDAAADVQVGPIR